MEKYLQKKRRLDRNIKITEKFYDLAMEHIFKQTSKIHLDEYIEKRMEKAVTMGKTKYSSKSYIFKYVFYINSYEYFKLSKNDNLIGLFIYYNQNKEKTYLFFYNGIIYPTNENIPIKYLSYDSNKARKIINFNNNYSIDEIPEEYWDLIFVFKLYIKKKKLKKKK